MNAAIGQHQAERCQALCRHAEGTHLHIQFQAALYVALNDPLALKQIGNGSVSRAVGHLRGVGPLIQTDLRIKTELSRIVKQLFEAENRHQVADYSDRPRIDHGVVWIVAGHIQLQQRVKRVSRRFHPDLLKYLVKSAVLKRHTEGNYLGNTLNGKPFLRIPCLINFSVPRIDTNSQIMLICPGKFWNIRRSLTLVHFHASRQKSFL